MNVLATEVVSDQGTVVVFGGIAVDSGKTVRFGVDHRMAQGLADLLDQYGEAECDVEGWQLLGGG